MIDCHCRLRIFSLTQVLLYVCVYNCYMSRVTNITSDTSLHRCQQAHDLPLCFFLQHIAILVQDKVLQFRGDKHFMLIWLWKHSNTFICRDILCVNLCAAEGHGAKGQNDYEFSLEFVLPVKPEVCTRCEISPKHLPLLSYRGCIVFGDCGSVIT